MSLETSQLNELHWLMEMLHNIDVGLVVLDRDYHIQIWNGFMENHSGLLPREVKGKSLFDLFDEIPQDWFRRKAESVFLLKNKAFTIWEQRPYLFRFLNYRPITGTADYMYQNSTFIPLLSATGEVTHLCLIIYDVTDNAVSKKDLERVNAELAVLSHTDALSGLVNRDHWQHCLQAEYKRWSRNNKSSSVLMLSIDNFNKINDNHGFSAGDEVIRHLSGLIRQHCREGDICGRYGGDDFALLLTGSDAASAKALAEQLRKAVSSAIIGYKNTDLAYSISLGLLEINKEVKNSQAWAEQALNSMLKAKKAGGNRLEA